MGRQYRHYENYYFYHLMDLLVYRKDNTTYRVDDDEWLTSIHVKDKILRRLY